MSSENSVGKPDDLSQLRPPGFVNEIVNYLYHAAPRPNEEPAIAGALGLLAGINGRHYTVSSPRTGLNLMIVLVMLSAMGKESMFRIQHLLHRACVRLPELYPQCTAEVAAAGLQFISNSDMASRQAMIRHISGWPCYVDLVGEFGKSFTEMAEAQSTSAIYGLRTMMLRLSDKSGPEQVVSGITYSNADNNVDPVRGPSYSMLGDTTPNVFYRSLDGALAHDGFLSRLTIIECTGHIRPEWVRNPATEPSEELLRVLGMMVWAALILKAKEERLHVEPTERARRILEAFDKECDGQINKTLDDTQRAVRTRSLMKVYRTSALLAIADYFHALVMAQPNLPPDSNPWPSYILVPPPQIEAEHVKWAINLERRAIDSLMSRLKGGDIGNADITREIKVRNVIYKALTTVDRSFDRQPRVMSQAGIVTYGHLAQQTARVESFSDKHKGHANLLKQTIRSLISAGWIEEVGKDTLKTQWSCAGQAYRISKPLHLFGDPT